MEHTHTELAMGEVRNKVRAGDWLVFMSVASVGYDLAVVGPVDGSVYHVMPWHIDGPPEADEQVVSADTFTPFVYPPPHLADVEFTGQPEWMSPGHVRKMRRQAESAAWLVACQWALGHAHEAVLFENV